MSASKRIKEAIMMAEVARNGWKPDSPEWHRAFGYMAGLHMALDLLQDPAKLGKVFDDYDAGLTFEQLVRKHNLSS